MDSATLGAALALMKSYVPKGEAAEAGEVLTVGPDGSWTKGEVTGATITVDGTTLTITTGGESE